MDTIKAVILVEGGSLAVPNLIPRYKYDYPTIIIGHAGASLSTGTLLYWSKQTGAEVVYEGEEIVGKFLD